jgi:hypothetical protein
VRNGKTRFYANVNGEQVQLGTKKGAAEKKLKELLNGRPKQIGPNPRVEELIDKFLARGQRLDCQRPHSCLTLARPNGNQPPPARGHFIDPVQRRKRIEAA